MAAAETVTDNALLESFVDARALSLTTIFTPPSSCKSHWTYEGSFYNSVSGGLLLQNAIEGSPDTDCFPPDFTNNGRASQSQLYSPGHCPDGYATPAQYVDKSITTMICCQSSFTYFSTITTIDNFSPATPMLFAGCLSTFPKGKTTTVVARSGDLELSQGLAVTGPVTMWGQPIAVAMESSDNSFFTTTTTSSSTLSSTAASSITLSGPVTVTAPAAPTGSSVSSDLESSSGLSTGAKAGIGIASAVVGLGLLAFAVWLLRRRRVTRLGSSESNPTEHTAEKAHQNAVYDPYRDDPKKKTKAGGEFGDSPTELDSSLRSELPTSMHQSPLVAELG